MTMKTPSSRLVNKLATRLVHIASRAVPGRPFYPYQQEFAMALVKTCLLATGDELSALFARQSGKTETYSRVIVILVICLPQLAKKYRFLKRYEYGFWVGIFAPVKEQAKTAYIRIIEAFESQRIIELMASEGVGYTEKNATTRRLSSGSFVQVFSASPGSNIESKTLHLSVLEESQDLGFYKVRKSIEPMTTATRGALLHIGTANEKLSPFLEAIQRNKKLQRANPERKLHFEYDWKTVIKYSENYAFKLNKLIIDRGKVYTQTDEFKMAYGLQFMLGRGLFCSIDRFMELEALCSAISVGPFVNGKCTLAVPIYFGIDWGKSMDSTVVTALAKFPDHHRVVAWLELQGDSYEQQYPAIVAFINQFPSAYLVIPESNGVGDPMVDRLKGAFQAGKIKCPVLPFWTESGSKSAGYKRLMHDLVQANRVLFPSDPAARAMIEYERFGEQLTELEKEWKGSLLKVKHADKKDAHDDYPDSLMLAHWGATNITSMDMYERFYGQQHTGTKKLVG